MAPLTIPKVGYEASPEQTDVILSIGAEFIGIAVAQMVWGCNITQTIRYFSNFGDDPWLMKFTVGLCAFLDTVGAVMYLRLLWFWSVLNWGNVKSLEVLDWSFFPDILLTATVPVIVQMYFTWRVYVISGRKRWYLPAAIAAVGVWGWGWGIATVPVVWNVGVPSRIHEWLWGVYIWFLSSAACDALITISMLYFVFRAKTKTAFRATRSVLDKFVLLVFETNAVTFLGALSILIAFATSSETSYAYNALTYVVSKVYFLSLLIATNSRLTLREDMNNKSQSGMTDHPGLELSVNTRPNMNGGPYTTESKQTHSGGNYAQGIKVTNLTVVEDDFGSRQMEKNPSTYGVQVHPHDQPHVYSNRYNEAYRKEVEFMDHED